MNPNERREMLKLGIGMILMFGGCYVSGLVGFGGVLAGGITLYRALEDFIPE